MTYENPITHANEAAPQTECKRCLAGVRDAMYVLNGKWKLVILAALSRNGPTRFRELQRVIGGVTPKLLSKELKELSLNELVLRRVYTDQPVLIEYELTDYGRESLEDIIKVVSNWGLQHRARIQSSKGAQGPIAVNDGIGENVPSQSGNYALTYESI